MHRNGSASRTARRPSSKTKKPKGVTIAYEELIKRWANSSRNRF